MTTLLHGTDHGAQLSVFDMFRIGIGPSSSHTVGPMRAARDFVTSRRSWRDAAAIRVELFGSLGATGRGHATDRAVVLGLMGQDPALVEPALVDTVLADTAQTGRLVLPDGTACAFDPRRDIAFLPRVRLPYHPNALRIEIRGADASVIAAETYFSVGGGFVVSQSQVHGQGPQPAVGFHAPFPFRTAAQVLEHCELTGLSIAEVVRANEEAARPAGEVGSGLAGIWQAMSACIDSGWRDSGVLPGGLAVPRRAGELWHALAAGADASDPVRGIDRLTVYALAVNEENAAGHRVVTAPTNGAAGIVPAVLRFAIDEYGCDAVGDVATFLLTATAVGTIIKLNASIAGAEVGCQGEIGSACAMAAAGLASILGGSPRQCENAAEIAMEHNLGLTCDPVGGLVQIPCIERNAIGAVKAVGAARMALAGNGMHRVSLDTVIATMRQTGADMSTKYKETSEGGLAVNVIEC